ncbi:unnamed protein product [Ceutorhynchus assimilis]|uniref:Uncharacterized protein n=1 Tax=Ceutorhynchus assimilis TaxID=467358 RepID=A0A9N9ML49_9CUCU|nr:unnamed protein product [Ceutorhynchus assimilis]
MIERCSDSQKRQFRNLIGEIELNDKKPSQLLREMRVLAKNFVSDTILQTLWLQRLPTNIQVVFSPSSGLDLTKMAEIVDEVIGVTTSSLVFIKNCVDAKIGSLSFQIKFLISLESSTISFATEAGPGHETQVGKQPTKNFVSITTRSEARQRNVKHLAVTTLYQKNRNTVGQGGGS